MQKISAAKTILYFSLLIVFILSIVNANEIPRFKDLSSLSDKLFHFLLYFYLAYLALLCRFIVDNYLVVLKIFIFGLFIEIIHFFHPYRFFEYLDLLANLIGVTIALLIFELKNNKSY
jgi:VanZ family protein